jgi:hypothetical protein
MQACQEADRVAQHALKEVTRVHWFRRRGVQRVGAATSDLIWLCYMVVYRQIRLHSVISKSQLLQLSSSIFVLKIDHLAGR